MKNTKKIEIRKMLAKNKYAKKPESVSNQQWVQNKRIMEEKYLKEWMNTPEGLYTDEQIWKQTFQHYLT